MKVASFYRFLDLKDPESFRDEVCERCRAAGLLGTVLVAAEGINGTLAGPESRLRELLAWLQSRLGLAAALEVRWTDASDAPFRRLSVRVKQEIVTLGRPDILPHRRTGRRVAPAEWNELLGNPDVLIIDTRNHYEHEVGTFAGAVDPGTDSFREFAAFASALPESERQRPVAMFCTGGIRCEKASALMLELGFDDVSQLDGGILNYLQQVPRDESRWQGECFIFDTRVALDRDLAEGGYVQCHACRRPLSSADLASPDYRAGVACPKCADDADPDRAARLRERAKQVALAKARGEQHIGPRDERQCKTDRNGK